MKAALYSVINELKRLREDGQSYVFVSDEALQGLKTRVVANVSNQAAPVIEQTEEEQKKEAAQAIESIPKNIRSASGEDFEAILKTNPEELKKKIGKVSAKSPFPLNPKVELGEGDKQARWNALRERVFACPVCNEHVRDGYKIVFGVGNLDADIFFCGEAPGADEEEQGEPFVGKAGQLLDKMIKAMGSDRSQVYIGNIMNWRPEMPTRTGNRKPTEHEMEFCLPYLKAQIEIVKPKVIVALGVTASQGLFGKDTFRSLREIKGQWREFEGIPAIATYHPSYLLRNSSHRDKRMAWEDLLKVMEKIGLPISDKQQQFFL